MNHLAAKIIENVATTSTSHAQVSVGTGQNMDAATFALAQNDSKMMFKRQIQFGPKSVLYRKYEDNLRSCVRKFL